jgi:hypothetical protein
MNTQDTAGPRLAHGTVVAPRDVYKCVGAASRHAFAQWRGFAVTTAPVSPVAQKK